MNKNLYIAYGSNINTNQMAYRCPDAIVVGKTYIENYALVFRGINENAVANIEYCYGNKVPAVVWHISHNDEHNLDRFEGYPRTYTKEYFEVKINGKYKEVMAYVMAQKRPLGIPSRIYCKKILDGYKTFGLDDQYLKDALLGSYQQY